jgi:hypothetical protein
MSQKKLRILSKLDMRNCEEKKFSSFFACLLHNLKVISINSRLYKLKSVLIRYQFKLLLQTNTTMQTLTVSTTMVRLPYFTQIFFQIVAFFMAVSATVATYHHHEDNVSSTLSIISISTSTFP